MFVECDVFALPDEAGRGKPGSNAVATPPLDAHGIATAAGE